jgi:hypothetical protein
MTFNSSYHSTPQQNCQIFREPSLFFCIANWLSFLNVADETGNRQNRYYIIQTRTLLLPQLIKAANIVFHTIITYFSICNYIFTKSKLFQIKVVDLHGICLMLHTSVSYYQVFFRNLIYFDLSVMLGIFFGITD